MKYPLASSGWGDEEIAAMHGVIDSRQFTMGAQVRQFEEEFAAKFGKRYGVMASSGSAANLLAIAAAVHHPDLDLNPGDEVLVPAVSWSTTYFPITQLGLKLRFVDIDPATLNIDLEKASAAITPKTKALFAVNLLGNPVEADKVQELCRSSGLTLLEDNCESMGARYGDQWAGAFGIAGTFSTFFSHHISTMEGGVVITDDRKFYHNLISLRAHGWVRDLPADSHLAHDFDDFVAKFRFVLPGYNLRPLELEGAIGIEQLKRLDGFVAERRANAVHFVDALRGLDYARIQDERGESSWFGFAIILQGKMKGRRKDLVSAFKSNQIDCRPIVTGNFLNNPVIDRLDHSIGSDIVAAEEIDTDGLFIGNHHYPIPEQIDHMRQVLGSIADAA